MSIASDRLALYIAAEANILAGQEVRHDGRLLRMADLAQVRAEIVTLQNQVAAEQRALVGRVGPQVALANFAGRGFGNRDDDCE